MGENNSISVADALALRNSGNNDGFNGNNAWWIIILVLFFAFAGFGRGGYGYGGNDGGCGCNGANTVVIPASTFGGTSSINDNYILASDFATIERKLDGVNNGLCDGFYAQNTNMLTGFDRITNNTNQGFAGLNTAIVTNGYETRNAIQQNAIAAMQGTNAIQSQIADCCCNTRETITNLREPINSVREAVSNTNYNLATQANNIQAQMAAQTNSIQTQLATCCCDTGRQMERGFCDTNYNLATQNNATLQAIDKMGDRIIDYLTNEKAQSLRDEVQALRLAASQTAQNSYLINQLRPAPVPAFPVANPFAYQSCNCNTCC